MCRPPRLWASTPNTKITTHLFMKTIHLGRKAEAPPPGADYIPDSDQPGPEEFFPSLYMHDIEGLEALPQKGTITLSYEVIERSETVRKGDKSSSVELEVREIVDYSGSTNERKKTTREEVEEVFSELDDE